MGSRAISGLALLAVFFSAATVRADEIRLKDGTKITGTIVGFENGSFRVETSYGFALIEKDKVADINITPPKKERSRNQNQANASQSPPASNLKSGVPAREGIRARNRLPARANAFNQSAESPERPPAQTRAYDRLRDRGA